MTTSNEKTDYIERLLFEASSIRAAVIHLNTTLKDCFEKHSYPKTIQKDLAELQIANLLLSTGIKFDGKLILQIQNHDAIKMMVTKSNQQHDIVSYADWNDIKLENDSKQTLSGGKMVLTLINDQVVKPYQSIVEIKPEGVAASLEHYFTQSAQIATKILIHIGKDSATGILLQTLPGGDESQLEIYQQSLLKNIKNFSTDNGSALTFLEQAIPDTDIQTLSKDGVQYHCGCSPKTMEKAIQTLGEQDAMQLLKTHKEISVTCEFCNNQYGFNANEVSVIFSSHKD